VSTSRRFTAASLTGSSLLLDLRPYGGGLLVLCFDVDSEKIVERISDALHADMAIVIRGQESL
jgi:hypothetical protein